MMQQEQVFFTDRSVYISNTRLVLRKGGTYPIANLAQVTLGRMSASRSWIGSLIFGLIFLAVGGLFNQNSLVQYSVLLNGEPYLVAGGSLLLIGFVSLLFQIVCPLYVVVLKGTFGTARPIKRRNRRYVVQVIAALNEVLSKRDLPVSPTVVQSTYIGQLNQDWSQRSNDIIIGSGAQANIGTFGNASGSVNNMKQAFDSGRPTFSPNTFNEAQVDPHTGLLNHSRVPGWADRPQTWPADQPGRASIGARKIIISYSHEDRQWLDLLKIHLAPLERQQMIHLWDDTQITVGAHWRQAISDALNTANFALLLVSANFLASDFIMRYEIPQILSRFSQGQITILPLILSPCLFQQSPLGRYQAFNLDRPLSNLSPPERDEILVRMAREVQKALL